MPSQQMQKMKKTTKKQPIKRATNPAILQRLERMEKAVQALEQRHIEITDISVSNSGTVITIADPGGRFFSEAWKITNTREGRTYHHETTFKDCRLQWQSQ
jgi:hypothetical protein